MMRQLEFNCASIFNCRLRHVNARAGDHSSEEYRIFDEKYSKAECHIGDGEDGSEDREDLIRVACETSRDVFDY